MHILCPHCRNPIELVKLSAEEILCPTCGSSFKLETGSTTGWSPKEDQRNIGKFEILSKVGVGAFGTVYKARDPELDRIVAIKVPRTGNLGDGKDLDRFLREARSVAQLRHPGIVPIYDVSQADGVPFLVSDFVDGVTLADQLTARQLPPREAALLIAQVADALQYAHERGVVHRDVKPSNIMLSSVVRGPSSEAKDKKGSGADNGRGTTDNALPMLMDFGLAKREAGEITMTIEGQVLGTPAYMSPEQARGAAHQVDGRSDVYSLGVIFYRLLTEELPFRGNTQMLLHQVLHDEPIAPRKLNNRIPRDLETICLKAMAKEPDRRYQTAGTLGDDLRRWLKGEPIRARPLRQAERLWRWCRRNPMVAALLFAVLCVTTAGVAGIAWFSYIAIQERDVARDQERLARLAESQTEKERDAAERNLYFADMRLANEAWQSGEIGRLEEILGRYGQQAAALDQRGWEWYYLNSLGRRYRILLGHTTPVEGVAWSPDNKRLATSDWVGTKIWDPETGEELQSLPGGGQTHWSPDGKYLAGVIDDNVIAITELTTGKLVLKLPGHRHVITRLRWSPDGKRLASASWDGTARVWDTTTGKSLVTFRGHSARVMDVCWSPDGHQLASASQDSSIQIWEVATGRVLRTLDFGNQVYCLAWSGDGQRLVSGGFGGEVLVWDPRTGTRLQNLVGHKAEVLDASWSPGDQKLITASADASVILWDVATGRPVRSWRGLIAEVRRAVWSPDGSRIASCSLDKTVRVWAAEQNPEVRSLQGHKGEVRWVTWSPDGQFLASTSFTDETLRIWKADTGESIHTIPGVLEKAMWDSKGSRLASANFGGATIWEAATAKKLLTFSGHQGRLLSVSWSPDDKRLASAGADGIVKVWDASTGKVSLSFQRHSAWVEGVSWSPNGRRLASASQDRTVCVWDVIEANAEPLVLRGHTSIVCWAEWDPQGTQIATASHDGTVRLWDTKTGKVLRTLRGHAAAVYSVSWSPDGQRLASSSADGTIKIWDPVAAKEILSLRGHASRVWSVAWSPDGRRLASGSADGTIKIWDATSGYASEQDSKASAKPETR